MNILKKYKFQGVALTAVLSTALLAGCDKTEPTVESTEDRTKAEQQDQDRPLQHIAEFDGFTLRANITPTERLPTAMVEQYGIEADPDRLLFNAIIYEKRSSGQPEPVSADVSVHYENLVGHDTEIDMRKIEANDSVSYIGTLDTTDQLVFRFVVEAQPEGSDQPLQADFEVQLPARNVN